MSLTFSEYQKYAETTAIYPDEYNLLYPALGLAGEAGEVAEKVKKIIRDRNGEVTPSDRTGIIKEVGDVMWYLAAIASDLDVDLGDIARINLNKLKSRAERGTIGGSGDNR